MFDLNHHLIIQLVIRAGKEIRKAKGLPEEKNISIIFNETAALLGISNIKVKGKEISKLPAPHELTDELTGKFIIPRKDCLECKGEGKMILVSLCKTCEDAAGGLYKTMWRCEACGEKEKSKKFFIQWLHDLKIDFKPGMKIDLGIKTATDQGDK
jgi:hypothetical protein